jgi:hypothetical protein
MKYLLILLLAFTLIGCVTQKRCNEKFPPQTITITKDSIINKEKIVIKDTTIIRTIPGDTVHKIDTVIGNKGVVNSKKVFAETSLAKATAYVYKNKLYLELIQKDTTLEFKLDSAIKEATYWKEKYQNSSTVVTKETSKSPWYMKVLAWIGSVCLVVIGIWFYKTKF